MLLEIRSAALTIPTNGSEEIMAAGRSYEGKSGKKYTFLLTDTSDTEKLPTQGGLIVITNDDVDSPIFIGAASNLRSAFENLHVWPKVGSLPVGTRFFLTDYDEGRYAALDDLVARYAPPLNDRF